MAVLVVFDIEAVPDFEAARRLLAQPDGTADAEIRRMLGERYSRDNEDPDDDLPQGADLPDRLHRHAQR
jgi:3'-5' exonuclease